MNHMIFDKLILYHWYFTEFDLIFFFLRSDNDEGDRAI